MAATVKLLKRFYSNRVKYDMPLRYTNSFYLANASLFDSTNWYLQRTYELAFDQIIATLKSKHSSLGTLTDGQVFRRIQEVMSLLDPCNSVIDIRFPITREKTGKREMVRGFRAQHGLLSGFSPTLGGLRIIDSVTRDQMKGFSVLATYKHSCLGIHMAGACGGIKINPAEYTEGELRGIIEGYTRELTRKGFLGAGDCVEPDVNCGGREMDWIARITETAGQVAGKSPGPLEGIDHYDKAGGLGVYNGMEFFLNDDVTLGKLGFTEKGLADKTFIIEGLGKLGGTLASTLEANGATCVGIREHNSQVFNPEGVDVEKAIEHFNTHGTLENFSKAKPISNDQIFTEECDMIILAGYQRSLNCYTADKVRAKVVVEASNGGLTCAANRILTDRHKLVLPDIFVSSGYCIASYLEFLKSNVKAGQESLKVGPVYKSIFESFMSKKHKVVASSTGAVVDCEVESEVLSYAIEHVMTEVAKEISTVAKDCKLHLDLRSASYVKAIDNILTGVHELNRL